MQAEYTAAELASLLGVSVPAVHKRAAVREWRIVQRNNPRGGGFVKVFVSLSFDDETRHQINRAQLESALVPSKSDACLPFEAKETPAQIRQCQLTKAMAKADLLRLYTEAVKSAGWGNKVKARKNFMRAYNSGAAWPRLFEIIGKTSWKTIEGWKRTVDATGDAFELADSRGYWRKGLSAINDEQAQILLRCVLHPNRPMIAESIRMAQAVMHARGIDNGHSESTYRRWIEAWRSENYHIWVFSRQGAKAWNDQCAKDIERDYNLINVGDILVADGHILNFEVINPWTGKPKRMVLILWYDMKSSFPLGWELMPTENTQSIASALRRAILRLGKMPKVAYLDNGKAFGARFFSGINLAEAGVDGLFERAGIKTIFAWPYHGQSKTVERFFGTFGELERLAPTYVGSSIDKKPPRLSRGEFMHRKAYAKVMGETCLTMAQAHRAIAAWFDVYARRPQRGHLEGACPLDVFEEGKGAGVDADALRYLMMSVEIKHIRKNGIRMFGRDYYHPELYGRRHPVIVRFDLQDPSAVFVSDSDGNFLCMATEPEKVHPAATVLGTIEDKKRLARHIADKKRQERDAGVSTRAFLEREILPEHKRLLDTMGLTETGPVENNLAETPAPALTVVDRRNIEGRVEAFYREKKDESSRFFGELDNLGEMDRYERLIEAGVRGMLIPRQWQAFMAYFEQTAAYKSQEDYFETHRAKVAMMYQVDAREAEG